MLKFGKVEAHRNTKNTAAVVQTPVSNGGGLGAGRCEGSGGNGRGDHGGFIEQKNEGNHLVYGRNRRGGEISDEPRFLGGGRRQGDVSMTQRQR